MEKQNNRDISGAKLLILHKQHYLQKYPYPLKSEYSCLGYFDGMDIIDVEETKTTLFELRCNSGISDIWYQGVREVQKLGGYIGSQNIGMFRCADQKEEKQREKDFWSEGKRQIFMSVSFLQISDNMDQEEFRKKIEQQSSEKISMLGYFTFDNADLILFMQSNSFPDIIKKIEEIDKMPQVRYIHPINGVYEKVLSDFDCDKKEKANFYDMVGNSLVNNDIKELRIKIVGNAGEAEEKLKYILDEADRNYKLKNYQEAVWSYMTDHENYVLILKDTDMRTALIMMTPKGVVTHQNGLFGSSVYNMETQIRLDERKFRSLNKKKPEESRSGTKGGSWCRGQIEQYGRYMNKALENEDQGLCSYCQAIIQTLNTLAQFGEFELSRYIFYIIYPAFKLFSEQLDSVCNDFENISRNPNKRKIQEAMRDFLDSVNSIMYHAIHMDQIFLMIPGCSGTSFSIPTKLSLFYLWFLDRVSKILNDTSNKYAFYLTPVMESKPCTYPIEFGLSSDKDRLVCVKVSQRSLYIPGELLIILTHEMAHYVGKEIRCRNVRWRKVKETMAALIAEAIIPFWCWRNKKSLCIKYKKIYMYVSEELQNSMDFVYTLKYEQELLYHVATVSKILKDECARILADENGELMKIITSRTDDDQAEDVPFDEMIKLVEEEERISGECNRRRIGFLGKGDCDRIIDMLLREYKEIFADAAAYAILQFERDDYSYAYNISEGYKVDELCMPNKDYNRKRLLFEEYTGKERTVSADMEDDSQKRSFEEKDLIEYWSNLDFVQNQMREYVSECKTKLKKHLEMPDTQKYITKIREAYLRFSTSEFSCRQIYSTINDNAAEYAKEIQKQLDDSQL